jgi:hypothetical protein
MQAGTPPDIELVRRSVTLDPETGILTRVDSGERAGCFHRLSGYRRVSIGNKKYSEHRIVWLLFTGTWPPMLDHINCDRTDNRPSNLRAASVAENARNRVVSSKSSTGLKGVTRLRDGSFLSVIMSNGKQYRLGCFRNPEDAHEAYARAAKRLHGEFARAS